MALFSSDALAKRPLTNRPSNRTPIANAGGSQSGTVGTPIAFSGAGSSDPDGTITFYAWTFGDGGTASGVSVSHVYSVAGTYAATLRVTDNLGATATASVIVTVTASSANQPPIANAGGNRSAYAGAAVAFSGAGSSDPDGTIASYAWNFGDGGTASGVGVSHAYAAAGNYAATLKVTDNLGASATASVIVSVTAPPANQPPIANAGGNRSASVGAAVAFSGAGSSDPDGTIASYAWTFGDGGTASGVSVSHAYAAAGSYSATLKVTDNLGATATASVIVTVTAPPANKPPIANAGGNQSAMAGSMVNFSGAGSSDPDGTIASYAWAFGDGGNASGMSVSHAYTAAGNYTATLTVTDNQGSSGSATATVAISAPPTNGPLTYQGQCVSLMKFGAIQDAVGLAVAVDPSGNALVGASVGQRPFVAKCSSSTSVLWSVTGEGPGSGAVQAVAADRDGNVLVTGHFAGTLSFGGGPLTSAGGHDIFVAKLSPTGAHLWSKRLGSSTFAIDITESGFGIAVDVNNDVVLTGVFDGPADFGGGTLTSTTGMDLFLVKFSSSGTHLWSKRVGSPAGGAMAAGVAIDANGNIFITGSCSSTVDFGGGPVNSIGYPDMFVAKYSAGGNYLWAKHFGSLAVPTAGTALAVDRSGNVVVTGTLQGPISFGGPTLTNAGYTDAFLAKYAAADGAHLWSMRFGGPYGELVHAVGVDNSGNITLSGRAAPSLDFGGGPLLLVAGVYNIFLASLAADGTHRWSKAFGVGSGDAFGLAVGPAGHVFVTGWFRGSADFGGGTITTSSYTDIFLGEFAP